MGYTIKVKDIVVEVATKDELRATLRAFGALGEKPKKPEYPERTTALFPPEKPIHPRVAPPVLSMEERMSSLYKDIQEEPRGGMIQIIKILTSTSEWITSTKLKENLTIEADALGGTLGAISKRAIKFGLKREDVLLREEDKHGVISFRLTPAMREAVRSESEKEQAM